LRQYSDDMTHTNDNYFQQVRASGRVFSFLGLLLGLTGGIVTGVAIKGLIGEPIVSGGSAVAFYVAFGASSLITFFVMLNYLMMNLQVSAAGLDIKFGMKSASVERTRIVAVRVADTKSRMFRALGQEGRTISQMWTVMGVGSGIEIDIANPQGGSPKTWFISSREAATLTEKLEALITDNPSPKGMDLESGPSMP
jgi:hypothetical protein